MLRLKSSNYLQRKLINRFKHTKSLQQVKYTNQLTPMLHNIRRLCNMRLLNILCSHVIRIIKLIIKRQGRVFGILKDLHGIYDGPLSISIEQLYFTWWIINPNFCHVTILYSIDILSNIKGENVWILYIYYFLLN